MVHVEFRLHILTLQPSGCWSLKIVGKMRPDVSTTMTYDVSIRWCVVITTTYLAILCDLLGWANRDLQLGNQNVTAWITWYSCFRQKSSDFCRPNIWGCASVQGCAHWSWWSSGKCHLQNSALSESTTTYHETNERLKQTSDAVCFFGVVHVGCDFQMDVSKNSGYSPQIIHFNRVFHYKPSILGYPYFWKHPNIGNSRVVEGT